MNIIPVTPETSFISPLLYPWLVALGVAGVVFLLILRAIYRRTYQHGVALNKVVLLVTVPKYESKNKEESKGIEQLREQIALAESLFSSIGGLRAERSFGAYLWGRRDHLALEIVATKGEILFYVVVPRQMQRFIEQHIHAQYPAAHVEESADYNIFLPHGVSRGAVLHFSRSYIFPIRTYKEIDTDPLLAVTNALSRLGTNGAAVQIVIRSAKRGWHRYGQRTASLMHQGKSFKEAYLAGHGSWYVRMAVHIMRALYPAPKKDNRDDDIYSQKQHSRHQLSALEQEMAKRVEEKTSKAGLDANIRVVVSTPRAVDSDRALDNILNAFNQFGMYQYGNRFVPSRPRSQQTLLRRFIYRDFVKRNAVLLNAEELASIFHFPLIGTETPNIRWLRSKKAAAPTVLPDEGVVLGVNKYRGEERLIRFATADRRRHCYIIGTTGSGKSVLMSEMVKQDIAAGRGVCVIDPHGSTVEDILECIPSSRANDVIYFDPADVERPMGLNMLDATTPAEMDFATQEMIAIFYKLVTDPSMIGPMFEHNMRNAMLTLMSDREQPGTLVEIPRIFTDTEFQRFKVKKVNDPIVRAFWEQEMAKTSDFHKSEMLGYLISKVGRFIENSMMRNIIGQSKSAFNLRQVMDEGKILLVNLSKGKIGDINANLLGLILVSKIQMAALSRADSREDSYKDFYLYIDEFQNFITDSIATILSEARKYKLNLIMAHQYIGQLVQGQDTKIRDAVLGNIGSIIAFRVGVEDTEMLAKEFEPVFTEYDLINIDRFHAYVRLLINNSVTRPFDIDTFPPTVGDPARAAILKQASRMRYGRDRREVEAEIIERGRLSSLGAPTVDRAVLL
ncbi:MAG: type IV secretory system conjugative DNA transfer family protein [Patescibacteria group bacterium]